MISFLQTVGPWVVFGGLFYFMMRHGGCGMGHAHGGSHGGQQSHDHRDGGARASDTVVDTTASEVRITDLERQIAALRNPGSSEAEASSAAQPAQPVPHTTPDSELTPIEGGASTQPELVSRR